MFKKMDDKLAAGIFCLIWEGFLYLGMFTQILFNSNLGWYLFLLDTIAQVLILYYDYKLERAERQLKRARKRIGEMSYDYIEYIHAHSIKDEHITEPVVFEMKNCSTGEKIIRKVG